MIELKELTEDANNLQSIIDWKSDKHLCDLIMAEPKKLTTQETISWVRKNSNDPFQVFRGIYIENELVGIARLMFINPYDKTAEVGLYIGKKTKRGIGLGSIVLNGLIKEGIEKFTIKKFYAKIRGSNVASLKLFRSIGFINEGRLKNHYKSLHSDEFDDVYYLAYFTSQL